MAIDYNKWIYTNSSTPKMDSHREWAAGQEKQKGVDLSRLNDERDAKLAESNAAYDRSARQNYINYMQAQKRLPSELNALGIRGGASESSLLRLGTNYGSNVAANNQARDSAANDIRSAYAKQAADVERDYAERISEAEQRARADEIEWEEKQLALDLQHFSAYIEGLYNTRSGYEKLIKKLKASNDPNKETKINLARRAMNMLGGSGSRSGGSSRRSYGGRGYGYGSSSSSSSNGNSPKDRAGATISTMRGIAGAMGAGIGSGAGHKPKGKRRTSNNGYLIHGETSRNWQ